MAIHYVHACAHLCHVVELPKSWPANVVSLMSVPLVGEELVVVHKPSKTLVVADLAFNFQSGMQRQIVEHRKITVAEVPAESTTGWPQHRMRRPGETVPQARRLLMHAAAHKDAHMLGSIAS